MLNKLDSWLLGAYLLLAIISLAVIASISPQLVFTQAIWLFIGLAVFSYLSFQDIAVYISLSRLSYFLVILLLLLTFIFGTDIRGSLRWIQIGSFHLQTSELAKPFFILAFSYLLSKYQPKNLKHIFIILVYLSLPIAIILKQPDMGTSLVFIAIIATQLFIASAPWWLFGLGGACLTLTLKYAPKFLHDYQLQRLTSFINPASDPLGSGYNVIQSIIAVGSGGLLGKGLGRGTQSHLRFLPEKHTDFIFASLVEELGVIGGSMIILILGAVLVHLAQLILQAKSTQSRLILAGVSGYLFFQSVINIGMNIGLAPVTGVTLPLVSYGGSSTLAIAITLGIASSIARSNLSTQPPIEIK